MTLTAYFPLGQVYAFHQVAEAWLLRRYAQTVTVDADGEPRVPTWVEVPVQVFRDPRAQRALADDKGQTSAERCTVYAQTKMRITNAADPAIPTASDVLFDVAGVTGEIGSAWVAVEVKGWRDALGWETVLQRQGQRGSPPWA